jgi:cytochrome c oxidase subunit 2
VESGFSRILHRKKLMNRICLVGIALILLATVGSARGHQASPSPRVIHMVAERFSFNPANVTVDEGANVELRLTSEDTAHGFRLVGLGNINIEIPKRGRGDIRVALDTSRPGTYTFECSRICGAGHGFMHGTLHVKASGKATGAPR